MHEASQAELVTRVRRCPVTQKQLHEFEAAQLACIHKRGRALRASESVKSEEQRKYPQVLKARFKASQSCGQQSTSDNAHLLVQGVRVRTMLEQQLDDSKGARPHACKVQRRHTSGVGNVGVGPVDEKSTGVGQGTGVRKEKTQKA